MANQRMSVENYIEVTDWLRQHKFRIEKEKLTQAETCSKISEELGYEVPISTIQRCGKIVDVQWSKAPPKPQPVPIERDAIMILIGAVCGLYVETGRTVPQALADLKSAYARESAKKQSEVSQLVDKPKSFDYSQNFPKVLGSKDVKIENPDIQIDKNGDLKMRV